MRCPYCNNEMIKGYIKSSHLFSWGQEKDLLNPTGNINLVKDSFKRIFQGKYKEAEYCPECKKIIMSVE
ncbi:PF20097 family protein [Anaerotignum sp.]